MDDSQQKTLKRQAAGERDQKGKRSRHKRVSNSLPPSQEALISSYFPKATTSKSGTDLALNREACEQVLATLQPTQSDQSRNTSQSSDHELPHQSQSSQAEQSQVTQTEGQATEQPIHATDQNPTDQVSLGIENKEIRNLVNLMRIHMNAVDGYIIRSPSRDPRRKELLILDKYVTNIESIAMALRSSKTKVTNLVVTIDESSEQEIEETVKQQTKVTKECFLEGAKITITYEKQQPTASTSTMDEEEASSQPLLKQVSDFIEEKIKKAKTEMTNFKVKPNTASTDEAKEKRTVTKRGDTDTEPGQDKTFFPPPSDAMQKICLEKAREYANLLQESNYIPAKPSALWITSFDNQSIDQLIDEAYYTTLPGKTSHDEAWKGALAVKVCFKNQKYATEALVHFKRNIKRLDKDTIAKLHICTPSFGAWKLFEMRTEYLKVDDWERVMDEPNINNPSAINKLITNLCMWNQGWLWERDIQKAHFVFGKNDINSAALFFKTGPMTFDVYKVLKKENRAHLNIRGMRSSVQINLIYTPYCCWGCYDFSHLKNDCRDPKQWPRTTRNGKPYCGLCDSQKLSNTEHKAAIKGCPTFDAWAEKLEEDCVYFQGGY